MKKLVILFPLFILSMPLSAAEYLGRSLYRHALDQIVVGYKMGCLSRSPQTTADQIKEGWDCRKLNSEDNLAPILRLEAEADLKVNKLLALNLIPLTSPLVLDNDEKIVGENVLDRVIGSIEMVTQLECTQDNKTDVAIGITCPRPNTSPIHLNVLINTDQGPRISKIEFVL